MINDHTARDQLVAKVQFFFEFLERQRADLEDKMILDKNYLRENKSTHNMIADIDEVYFETFRDIIYNHLD